MYNTCTFLGCIADDGVHAVEKRTGTRLTHFRLRLRNTRQDGQAYWTVVDIEAYGQALKQAEGLTPGTVVLVEGKVAPRRGATGDTSLAIVARQIQPLPAEAAAFLDAREVDRDD